MPTEIGGFNETQAAALFAPQANFMLGCQFASLVLDTFLGGILVMQVHQYFAYQKNDKLWTRCVVGWTFLMNILVTCYYWSYISYLFVTYFGEWLPWLEVQWLAKMPTFDVLCVSVVQSFFAYRAFLLTRRNWFVLVIAESLILAAFGAAIALTVVFGSQPSLLGADKSGPTLITWTATTTAADVLIAVCILYGLLKSKSGWAHTDRLVTRLIRLTFEAQLPPTFLSIAYVVEWVIQPSSLLGAVFQALQCKAYTVGLMFSLNARISMTSDAKTLTGAPPQVFGMSQRQTTNHLEVAVETETYINYDQPSDKKTGSLSDFDDVHRPLPYDSTARLTSPDPTHIA
ncbi:hypothetical protein BD324DRAFT_618300 [Kockovaella imperatae]|uniref:DUF6534 domain-containing protein n=1 Tax=Kockovaella imperatae TaxID=4999 RepID=A0A1Y1UPH2_9TREE|nr:hypothetical protein BD324DRAFT_618300 [Kockovaella imperatae]ORX39035.1 hypothetical protein BD324DRAFT_618300 [Kockovaella imperatae]